MGRNTPALRSVGVLAPSLRGGPRWAGVGWGSGKWTSAPLSYRISGAFALAAGQTEAAANVAGSLPCHRRSRKGPSSQMDGLAPARKRSGGGSSLCCVAGPAGRELGGDQGSGLVLWLLWVAKVYFCEFDWMGLYWMGLKQFVIGRNLF